MVCKTSDTPPYQAGDGSNVYQCPTDSSNGLQNQWNLPTKQMMVLIFAEAEFLDVIVTKVLSRVVT